MDIQHRVNLKRSLLVVTGALVLGGCSSFGSDKAALQEPSNKITRAQQFQNELTALTQQVSLLADELNQLKGYVMSLGNSLSQASANPVAGSESSSMAAKQDAILLSREPELAAELQTDSGMRFAQRLLPRQPSDIPVVVADTSGIDFNRHMKLDNTVFFEAPVLAVAPVPAPVSVVASLMPTLNAAPQLVSLSTASPSATATPAMTVSDNAGESVMIYDDFIVLRVAFHPGQTQFNISPEMKQLLLRAAKESKFIDIQGYTDADVGNKKSELTAANRAQSAFEFLQSHGIADERITKASKGAGGFYADNKTTEGRTKNRRVEIALIGLNARKFESGQVLAQASVDKPAASSGRFVLR